jgi:hypothetical protein
MKTWRLVLLESERMNLLAHRLYIDFANGHDEIIGIDYLKKMEQ